MKRIATYDDRYKQAVETRRMILILLLALGCVLLLPLLAASADAQRDWDLSCRMKVLHDTTTYEMAETGRVNMDIQTGSVRANTYCKLISTFTLPDTGVTYRKIAYLENGVQKQAWVRGTDVGLCMYTFADENGMPAEKHELIAPAGSISLNGRNSTPSGEGKKLTTGSWTYYAKAGGATLYLQSNEREIISTHPAGTRATLLSTDGTWGAVIINGQKGYMKMSQLTQAKPSSVPADNSEKTVMYVATANGGALKLRKTASQSSPPVTRYEYGTAVTVYSRYNGWAYAVGPDGQGGYMMLKHLSETRGTAANSTADEENDDGVIRYIDTLGARNVPLWSNTGSGSDQTGQFEHGAKVTAFPVKGQWCLWCYVTAKGVSGYVETKYLKASRPAGSKAAQEEPEGTVRTMYVSTGNEGRLNLRKSARKGSASLGRYENGTAVTVKVIRNGWAQVSVNGKNGYMQADMLVPEPPAQNETTPAAGGETRAMYVNTGNEGRLHLRKAMRKTSDSLGLFDNGTAVTVHAVQSGWAQVTVDGKRGYMLSAMLSDTPPAPRDTTPTENVPSGGETRTMYVSTGNEGRLHLRKAMRKTSDSLGLFENGTAVTVHAVQGGWAQVTVNGQSGYMLRSLLADTPPTQPDKE